MHFFQFLAVACIHKQICLFCLSIVDITIYSWLTEKYSQYDKSCKTAQLNCIQPFIHMNDYSYIHMKNRCVKFDCIQYSCTTTTSRNHIENFRYQSIMIIFVNNTLKTFDMQRCTPQKHKFTAYVCIQKTYRVFSFSEYP